MNIEQLADSHEVAVKQEEIEILEANQDEPETEEPVRMKIQMQDEVYLDVVRVIKET